jgi:hypothetical protein
MFADSTPTLSPEDSLASHTIKSNYQTTFHRDGTVSYWDVYQQQWVRQAASQVRDQDLASMGSSDRERVQKMAEGRSE